MKTRQYIGIICVVLAFVLFFFLEKSEVANSYEAPDVSDLIWTVDAGGNVVITGAVSLRTLTDIVIPEEIEGRKVVKIADHAFDNHDRLQSVEIPRTVSFIGESTFWGTSSLEKIVVDSENKFYTSVDGVLYNKDMSYLLWVPAVYSGTFIVPDTVNSISFYAFTTCKSIDTVHLSFNPAMPHIALDVGSSFYSMLFECKELKKITVAEEHPHYKSIDGVLLSKDGKTLFVVPPAFEEKSYTVPEDVERIASNCFGRCTNVENINLSNNVKILEKEAFFACPALKEVIIPEGLKEIWEGAFYECTALQTVSLPDSLTFLAADAFRFCNNSFMIEAGERAEEIKEAIRSQTDWHNEQETAEESILFWETNFAGEIIITGGVPLQSVTKVVIPEEIEGKKVVEIAANAFTEYKTLRSIEIPATVTTIQDSPFWGQSALEEIIVSENNAHYTSVDGVLYSKDKSCLCCVPNAYIGTFVVPAYVKYISGNAFSSCDNLEAICFSNDSTSLNGVLDSENALNIIFSDCGSLKQFIVPESHPNLSAIDGVLFSKDGKKLLAVPPGYESGGYTVPDGVEQLASHCFARSQNIEKVVLPEGLKVIDEYTFMDCKVLKEVILPEGVKEIWNHAFYECYSLQGISLPESIQLIETDAFKSCDNLVTIEAGGQEEAIWSAMQNQSDWIRAKQKTEHLVESESIVLTEQRIEKGNTEVFTYQIIVGNRVLITGLTDKAEADKKNRIITIPYTIDGMQVVGIEGGAFAQIPLVSVVLPEGLLEIGTGAFYGCNLREVVIPASVYYIAPRVFGANYGLESITVEEGNESYCSEEGVLYNAEKTILQQVPAKYKEVYFTVPGSVKVIGEYAFGNNRTIKKIEMDEDNLDIRAKAFWNMLSLEQQSK